MASSDDYFADGDENFLKATPDIPNIPETLKSQQMITSNTFSQVIFPNIPDFFPPESDITISYVLTDFISPTSRDWIGLFCVGWSSPRDYATYVWATKPKDKERSFEVTFNARQLPGNDNEFYQVCYVTKQGYVRGASTPFQFRLCTENDCLVEVEDENGMIILKTRSDNLQDQLNKNMEEKAELESLITDLKTTQQGLEDKICEQDKKLLNMKEEVEDEKNKTKNQIKEMTVAMKEKESLSSALIETEKELNTLTVKLSTAEKKILDLSSQICEMEKQLKDLENRMIKERDDHGRQMDAKCIQLDELTEKIKDLSLVKEGLQQTCRSATNDHEKIIKDLNEKNDEMAMVLRRYREERDIFKDQFTKSEVQRNNVMHQEEATNASLQKMTSERNDMQCKLQAKETDIASLSKQLDALESVHKEVNQLRESLRDTMDHVSALETDKRMLSDELTSASSSRDQLMSDVNFVKKEKEEVHALLTQAKSEAQALSEELIMTKDRLIDREKRLNEHQEELLKQRREEEQMEQTLHAEIVLLRKQVEQSDTAYAKSCSLYENVSTGGSRRDKLMADVNLVKKEKEEMHALLTQAKSEALALSEELMMTKNRLTDREKRLNERQEELLKQRREEEQMKQTLHAEIELLRRQVEESDTAYAKSCSLYENVTTVGSSNNSNTYRKVTNMTMKKDTQTAKTTSSDDQETEMYKQNYGDTEMLKKQVEDLKTRLALGAEAYKDKFVECHQLEKKVKKLRENQRGKPSSSASPKRMSTSSSDSVAGINDTANGGFMDKIEKLFLSIADPDAEEQQHTKQMRMKLAEMEKSVKDEKSRSRKYKQLYSNLKTCYESSSKRQSDLGELLKNQTSKLQQIMDENVVLKHQIREFVHNSSDVRIKLGMNMFESDPTLDFRTTTTSNSHITGICEPNDDEVNLFEDAPGVPMYMESSEDQFQSTSSDEPSDEALRSSAPIKHAIVEKVVSPTSHAYHQVGVDSATTSGGRKKKSTEVKLDKMKNEIINRQPSRRPPNAEFDDMPQSNCSSSNRGSGHAASTNTKKMKRVTKKCSSTTKKSGSSAR